MKKKGLCLVCGSIIIILGLVSAAWSHMVFGIYFQPSGLNITKPGVYECDVTVDPLYAKVGFVLQADQASLPDNVHVMIMPPVGFFKYANDPPKTLKMTIIAGPKAQQGSRNISLTLTQIIPPYDKDVHIINGPYLNISFQ